MAASAGWYPKAIRRPLSKALRSSMRPVRVNLHTAVSNSSDLLRLFNLSGQAYSHFYIDRTGRVLQYVPTTNQAACDLDGNRDTISIETWDGYPNGWSHDSDVPPWTPEQRAAIIDLLRWIWEAHPSVPRKLASDNRRSGNTSHGISWHRLGVPGYMRYQSPEGLVYTNSRGKACPGNRRIAQIPGIFTDAVSAGVASPGVPSTGVNNTPAPAPIAGGLTMSEAQAILDRLNDPKRGLPYLSEQIKVTAQALADKTAALAAQNRAIAEGAFGRDAINARNADTAAIVERVVSQALAQVPGVDQVVLAKVVSEATAAALAEVRSDTDVDAILDGIAKRMEA